MTDPTRRSGTRFMVCAGFTIVGVVVAWRFAHDRIMAHESTRSAGRSSALTTLLEKRAKKGPDLIIEASSARPMSPHLAFAIPAEDARILFPIDDQHFVYDPYTYFRYRTGLHEEVASPEYPGGHYTRRTSLDGFREDSEIRPAERDFLVVVAGDSQTDGVCSNTESYANRAETELSLRHPDRAIEVLNAGVSAFSFYNYLGTLEKLVELKPDVFVMAFYAGNDFKDLVVSCHYFQRTLPPLDSPDYVERLKHGIAILGPGAAIALNPILYFKYEPEEARLAETTALDLCARVQRLCLARGIDLLVIHIPPAFRPGRRLPAAWLAAQRALDLSDEDMRTDDRMAGELIEKLREWNVDVLDLRDHLPEDIESYYWSDMHLNLKGQAFVAELLAPELERVIARRVPASGAVRAR